LGILGSSQHLAWPKQQQKSLIWGMRLLSNACYGSDVI
jgi:hypothetical protein